MTVVRHMTVQGRVQGVGFRAFIEVEALKRGIAGWVRNRRDGSVEAVFVGEAAAVADMIAVSRQGPSGSRVTALHERDGSDEEIKLRARGDVFSVLPTV